LQELIVFELIIIFYKFNLIKFVIFKIIKLIFIIIIKK